MTDDANLIAESIGDPELFAGIFDRHYDRIAGYLRRRADPSIADELAAQTFLAAFESRDRYDAARPDAAPWLYGIATNLLRRHRRSEQRRFRAYAAHASAASIDLELLDLDARADASAAVPALMRSLSRLRRGDREALLLLAWADLGYADIAAALQIPVGTVRSRINRARRHLVDDLDLPGRDSPPAPGVAARATNLKESE